jgi:hypothetical protein
VRIELHPRAESEIFEAACWYEDRRDGLGDQFLEAVSRAFDFLVEAPQVWRSWPGAPSLVPPIKRMMLLRFPYAVGYRVFDDVVRVLAVAHTSRKPFYWAQRIDT